jgi:hypothetical protein
VAFIGGHFAKKQPGDAAAYQSGQRRLEPWSQHCMNDLPRLMITGQHDGIDNKGRAEQTRESVPRKRSQPSTTRGGQH